MSEKIMYSAILVNDIQTGHDLITMEFYNTT